MTWLKLRCFPGTFIPCSDCSEETFLAKHLFFKHLFLGTCFTVNYFMMNWTISFNICNFFRRCSKVFDHIAALKNYSKLTGKQWCWNLFLIKLQAPYLQPASFIKKETPAHVFSCEFPRDCFCNFNSVKVPFLIYRTRFTKLRYFSNIIPKSINLVSLESHCQSGASFYNFFSKTKEIL